jgi:hypothetical protein
VKKFIFIFVLSIFISLGASAQDNAKSKRKTVPPNFKSDGCSLFFDGDYRHCCVEHDKLYYVGGSWEERWQADKLLFKCVAKKRGWWHKPLAAVMWVGVRIGGVPFLPTPFRWGFGQKNKKKPPKQKMKVKCKNAETRAR